MSRARTVVEVKFQKNVFVTNPVEGSYYYCLKKKFPSFVYDNIYLVLSIIVLFFI